MFLPCETVTLQSLTFVVLSLLLKSLSFVAPFLPPSWKSCNLLNWHICLWLGDYTQICSFISAPGDLQSVQFVVLSVPWKSCILSDLQFYLCPERLLQSLNGVALSLPWESYNLSNSQFHLCLEKLTIYQIRSSVFALCFCSIIQSAVISTI